MWAPIRSSRPEVFLRKGVLKICSSFTGEIALWHGCSPVNLLHILRKSFFKKISGRLYLHTDPFSDRSITFITIFGSSHRRCSIRKSALRNFAKFTEKTCARVTFLNKVAGLRISFLQNTSGRLPYFLL